MHTKIDQKEIISNETIGKYHEKTIVLNLPSIHFFNVD